MQSKLLHIIMYYCVLLHMVVITKYFALFYACASRIYQEVSQAL